jgi:hypothetical protein
LKFIKVRNNPYISNLFSFECPFVFAIRSRKLPPAFSHYNKISGLTCIFNSGEALLLWLERRNEIAVVIFGELWVFTLGLLFKVVVLGFVTV